GPASRRHRRPAHPAGPSCRPCSPSAAAARNGGCTAPAGPAPRQPRNPADPPEQERLPDGEGLRQTSLIRKHLVTAVVLTPAGGRSGALLQMRQPPAVGIGM